MAKNMDYGNEDDAMPAPKTKSIKATMPKMPATMPKTSSGAKGQAWHKFGKPK